MRFFNQQAIKQYAVPITYLDWDDNVGKQILICKNIQVLVQHLLLVIQNSSFHEPD